MVKSSSNLLLALVNVQLLSKVTTYSIILKQFLAMRSKWQINANHKYVIPIFKFL